MKKLFALAAAVFAMLVGGKSASADDTGPWELRVHGTYLDMANDSQAFSALGLNFPANSVHVNSKLIPEFDISYFITKNFSAELVLTVPQTQTVTLVGAGTLGTFKHLPPVLSAQYHFLSGAGFDPYIGLGANFTLIYDTQLSVDKVPLSLGSSSVGVGFVLNFDVKKVTLRSDVSVAGGAYLTTAKLDPWLLSAGIGWRF